MTPDRVAGSIANPQSLNRYAYVGNNPVNFVDPLGLNRSPFDDEVGVSIACISFYYPVMRAMSDERIVEFYESAMWCTVNRSDGSGGGGRGMPIGPVQGPKTEAEAQLDCANQVVDNLAQRSGITPYIDKSKVEVFGKNY
jgi:hypothetical protein